MILRSNKASSIVLMNTIDYVPKMNSVLSDHLRFKQNKNNKDLTEST